MSNKFRCVYPDAFDREGDITEVFDKVRQLQHTGVVVHAAHNRSLDCNSERLWSKLEAQPISLSQEIELAQTSKRSARTSIACCKILPCEPPDSLSF